MSVFMKCWSLGSLVWLIVMAATVHNAMPENSWETILGVDQRRLSVEDCRRVIDTSAARSCQFGIRSARFRAEQRRRDEFVALIGPLSLMLVPPFLVLLAAHMVRTRHRPR